MLSISPVQQPYYDVIDPLQGYQHTSNPPCNYLSQRKIFLLPRLLDSRTMNNFVKTQLNFPASPSMAQHKNKLTPVSCYGEELMTAS